MIVEEEEFKIIAIMIPSSNVIIRLFENINVKLSEISVKEISIMVNEKNIMPKRTNIDDEKFFLESFKSKPIIINMNEKELISNEKINAVSDVPMFAPKIIAKADFSLIKPLDKKTIVIIVRAVDDVRIIVIIMPKKKAI